MWRVVIAFGVTIACLPLAVLALATGDALQGALRVAVATALGVLGLGLPAFWFFRCRGWWQHWRFVLGGAAGGLLLGLLFPLGDAEHRAFFVGLFALVGAVHALLFWFIAVWRNPRLTSPRQYCLPDGFRFKAAAGALRIDRRREGG